MSRGYKYGSAGRAQSRTTTLRTATAERSYMCSVLHDIPSETLLAQVDPRRVLNYQPFWSSVGRSQNFKRSEVLHKDQVCLASFLTDGRVSFLPMDKSAFSVDSVNYAIGYDFALSKAEYSSKYAHVYSFGGFSIVSIPQQDFVASLRFYAQHDYANALLFSDRAITNLASINPRSLTKETERSYEKFSKLLSLWLSVNGTPEGDLAAKRALQFAQRCFTALTAQEGK